MIAPGLLFASATNSRIELAGTAALTKTGPGLLKVFSQQLYTGLTNIAAGSFELVATGTASGSLAAGSAVSVTGTGTLTGTGTASGTVLIGSGGTVAPGNIAGPAAGTLHLGSAAFAPGGIFSLNLTSAPGGGLAGTNWSQLAVAGSLDLSALAGTGSFTVKLNPLADGSTFNSSVPFQHWASVITFASLGGSFASNAFTIDSSAFAPAGSLFELDPNGSSLDLVYTIPEPATTAMALGGAAWLLVFVRRRQRRAQA